MQQEMAERAAAVREQTRRDLLQKELHEARKLAEIKGNELSAAQQVKAVTEAAPNTR